MLQKLILGALDDYPLSIALVATWIAYRVWRWFNPKEVGVVKWVTIRLKGIEWFNFEMGSKGTVRRAQSRRIYLLKSEEEPKDEPAKFSEGEDSNEDSNYDE